MPEPTNMPELTKITVHLIRQAVIALDAAAERGGLSRTDTVNRALQIYYEVTQLAPGAQLTFFDKDAPVTLQRTTERRRMKVALEAVLAAVLAFAAGWFLGRGG